MVEKLGSELASPEFSSVQIWNRLVRIIKAYRNRRLGIENKNEEVLVIDPEQKKKHLSDAQEVVYRRTNFLRDLPAVYRKQAENDLSLFCRGPEPFSDYWRERLRWDPAPCFLEVIRSLVSSPLRSQGNAFVELLSSHSLQSRFGLSAGPNPRRLGLYEATIIQVPRSHELLDKYRNSAQNATIDITWDSEVSTEQISEQYNKNRYEHVVSNTLRRGEQWWKVNFGNPESTTKVPTNIVYATGKIRPDIAHNLPSPNRQDVDIDLVRGRITVSTYQDPEVYSIFIGAGGKETQVSRTVFELGADGWASPTSGDSDALHYVSFVREIAETVPKEMFVTPLAY